MTMRTTKRPIVLAVDDHEDHLRLVEELLRQDDRELVLARSGEEALDVLRTHDVALAVLDLHMPEMDGIELAKRMRGMARTRHIPILVLTGGSSRQADLYRAYDAGAADVLTKPLEGRVLQKKVDVFLRLSCSPTSLVPDSPATAGWLSSIERELKTPVETLLADSTAIRDTSQEEDSRRTAARVLSSRLRLARMIDDLAAAAHEGLGGGMVLTPQRLDLSELVRRVVDAYVALHPQRVFELSQQPGLHAFGDEARCEHAVHCLLSNAVTHGANQEPVRVSLVGTQSSVVLRITNGGVIPAAQLPHLFDPLARTSVNKARQRGIGLGLYLVQKTVRAHEGTLRVDTSAEGGTSVEVELPRSSSGPMTALPSS